MVRRPQQKNQRRQAGEDEGQQQEGVDVGQLADWSCDMT
jgi:hypothetical protein